MKKAFLLSLLLVVAASAAITITFPSGPPTKVGVPVPVTITSDAGTDSADLFVNPGSESWVVGDNDQTEVALPYNGNIEMTHTGTGLTLYASKGGDTGESESFDVVVGDAAKWLILGPGETHDPGNADNPFGKTGSAVVTAGVESAYTIYVCDKWNNIENASPDDYTLGSDDPFMKTNGNMVELRRVWGVNGYSNRTVNASGGAYERDSSIVRVNVSDPVALLIVCPLENRVPGDDSTSGYPGKSGDAGDGLVGTPYIVDIYAVDECWNVTPDYDADDVNVYDVLNRNLTNITVPIVAGVAEDVAVNFISSNDNEKISAGVLGGLTTSYDTDVKVAGGVDKIIPSLSHESAPVGVHSTLDVLALEADGDSARGVPIYMELISGDVTHFFDDDDDDTLWTDVDGLASVEVWADSAGEYVIELSSGDVDTTVTFTVYELGELVVYPNPFKYLPPDITDINFKYEVGEAGADEIILLVADIGGNVVYKATYTTGTELDPGFQIITWDGMNSNGVKVASGLYQAVLKIKSGLVTDVYPKNFMVIW